MREAPPSGNDSPALTDEERAAIDAIWERRLTATHYELLGVPREADRRAIRDAYFALSKRFHPDVFYRRDLGDHRQRLDEVFRMLTRAYDVLSNAKQRAGYDLHLENIASSRPPPPEALAAVEIPRPAPVPVVSPAPPARPATVEVPDGAVIPPPMRAGVAAPTTPPPATSAASQPIDPAVRQRALEAMRRRLGAVVPGAARPQSGSPPPAPSAPFAAPPPRSPSEEREARLARLLGDGEEAQKKGDFATALEHFRNALSVSQGDAVIKARVDAVDQLVKAQRTGEFIEKAREAMRDGKAELAAGYWEKAWEGRPTDATLLVNAAEVLAKYGNNRGKAKELAQRALQVDPKAVKAHVVLAQVFTAAGLKASARAAIEAIERLEPNNATLKDLREKLGPPSLAEQLGRWNR